MGDEDLYPDEVTYEVWQREANGDLNGPINSFASESMAAAYVLQRITEASEIDAGKYPFTAMVALSVQEYLILKKHSTWTEIDAIARPEVSD